MHLKKAWNIPPKLSFLLNCSWFAILQDLHFLFALLFDLNLFLSSDNIKRKLRRRPIWGRGIIRKKKIYKKEEAEEDDEPEEEEGADESAAMVQGDACLTQDESSCDAMELHPDKQPLQANGHVLSTEEENSSEPTATQDPQGEKEPIKAPSEEASSSKEATTIPAPQECVNGNESMDSVYSEALDKETEVDSINKDALEAEHKEPSAPECNAEENVTAAEGTASDGDHETEGMAW